MEANARDVMTTEFHTLFPQTPIAEAVKIFKKASEKERSKVFGMMVTDDQGRLVGILSMYDILLFMRPKHIHIWGMMEDIDVTGLVDSACERVKSLQVGDIMTTEVITITPETHVMMILDIMIKKHVRRIPVVENDKIHGIVYISNLFYRLLGKLDA
jgi:CBS domain-containing protein